MGSLSQDSRASPPVPEKASPPPRFHSHTSLLKTPPLTAWRPLGKWLSCILCKKLRMQGSDSESHLHVGLDMPSFEPIHDPSPTFEIPY